MRTIASLFTDVSVLIRFLRETEPTGCASIKWCTCNLFWRLASLKSAEQSRLETQGRGDVAAWVWRSSGGRIPSSWGWWDFRILSLKAFKWWDQAYYIIEDNMLYLKSTDLKVNLIWKIPSETSKLVFDQMSGFHVLANWTHKINCHSNQHIVLCLAHSKSSTNISWMNEKNPHIRSEHMVQVSSI